MALLCGMRQEKNIESIALQDTLKVKCAFDTVQNH